MKKNYFSFTLFIFISIFIPLTFPHAQELITITTYYPSPHGVYGNLRLVPTADVPACASADDEGVFYYDSGRYTLRVCRFNTTTNAYELQDIGAGHWTLQGTNLYTNDVTWNVGIGTITPDHKLVVGAAANGRHLVVNAPAGGRWGLTTGGNDLSFQSDYGGGWNTKVVFYENGTAKVKGLVINTRVGNPASPEEGEMWIVQ
ncbi:MAG: hypothetical protein WC546_06585 [Candidatus Omnitrophota bacterium]|jgi:hypothetical protein